MKIGRPLRLLMVGLITAVAGFMWKRSAPVRGVQVCHVAQVDSQFQITPEDVRSSLQEAIQVWEQATGRRLFHLSDSDGMPVSLIYERRQELLDRLREKGSALDTGRGAYEAMRNRLEAELDALKRRLAVLDEDTRTYNRRVRALNEDVANRVEDAGALAHRRSALESEGASLQARQEALLREDRTLREDREALVQAMEAYNLDAGHYQALQDGLGTRCEAAVYQREGRDSRIFVYLVPDRRSLVRILAHELGHALGIGHVDDPDALMHPKTRGGEPGLTPSDLAALAAVERGLTID